MPQSHHTMIRDMHSGANIFKVKIVKVPTSKDKTQIKAKLNIDKLAIYLG